MATDLDAEEPCTICGHARGWHKHDDACRFEDCRCRLYDSIPTRAGCEEPFDTYGIEEMDGPQRRPVRVSSSTSRDGNWHASIGNGGEP